MKEPENSKTMQSVSFDLQSLIRENIKNLKPYSTARHEFKGRATVLLDANENAYGSPLEDNFNRYPDPFAMAIEICNCQNKRCTCRKYFYRQRK